jgi:hypothetical protein
MNRLTLRFIVALSTFVVGVTATAFWVLNYRSQTESVMANIPMQSIVPSPLPVSPNLTIPGHSVGLLRLGDTRERVFELFPKKPNYDEEYNYGQYSSCVFSEIHWLEPDFQSNGLFIYLRDGRIFQIMVETPRFPTVEGIKQYGLPKEVRRHYPNLKAYALLGSGGEIVGGRDLVYWVSSQSGIAFEFYYDRKEGKRLVKSVIVFEPSTEFQPNGCVSVPQELREIEPYSLEPPTDMIREHEKGIRNLR